MINEQKESDFKKYISEALQTVEKWPDWKKNVLGVISGTSNNWHAITRQSNLIYNKGFLSTDEGYNETTDSAL